MAERFNEIIQKIIEMLKNKGINIKEIIKDFEQTNNYQKRIDGYKFTIRDYLRGLFYALSSQTRKWKKDIMPYINQIDNILFNYDPELLLNVDQEDLCRKIKATGANIYWPKVTIENLIKNIPKLQYLYPLIEKEFGKLKDDENIIQRINKFAKQLSDINSKEKLNGIGDVLVREFLKNIGIPSMKPDVHLKRIGSINRLGFFKTIEDEKTTDSHNLEQLQIDFNILTKTVDIEGVSGLAKIIFIDNLIWMFGADGYGEICNTTPKCEECLLKDMCKFPRLKI